MGTNNMKALSYATLAHIAAIQAHVQGQLACAHIPLHGDHVAVALQGRRGEEIYAYTLGREVSLGWLCR